MSKGKFQSYGWMDIVIISHKSCSKCPSLHPHMREDVYTTRQYCILRILSQTIEPVGGYTTDSVTHGQCDARPTVTFSANGRCQFILLGEQRHTVCGQVAQSRYVNRSGRDSNLRLLWRRNQSATTPHREGREVKGRSLGGHGWLGETNKSPPLLYVNSWTNIVCVSTTATNRYVCFRLFHGGSVSNYHTRLTAAVFERVDWKCRKRHWRTRKACCVQLKY